jgi:hypothetical protein
MAGRIGAGSNGERSYTAPRSRLRTVDVLLRLNHMGARAGKPRSSNGPFRQLSAAALRVLVDKNAKKYLGVRADEVLRRRKQGKPIRSPAWGPIEMLASLLPD